MTSRVPGGWDDVSMPVEWEGERVSAGGDRDSVLPPECDYCDQALWDDEELTPIYVGPPGETSFRGVARRDPKAPISRHYGRKTETMAAVLNALDGSDNVEIDHGMKIAVVGESRPRYAYDRMETEYDTEYGDVRIRDTDEVGVRVRITPERGEPDMQVCKHCAGEFTDE